MTVPRRRAALALALLLGVGPLGCRRAEDGGASADRPSSPGAAAPAVAGADVLLVTIDTLRADAPGFAGNAAAATPVLDRLAAGGRVFTRAHAHSVVTLPSHANLLTGRLPYEHGVRDNAGFALGDDVPTLATLLRDAGWATAAFVGAFPLDHGFGLARGFDVYDDRFPRGSRPDVALMAERPAPAVIAPALAWWRSREGARRFLWVHVYDPHAPYAPPEPFASRFRDRPYDGEVAAVDAALAPLLAPFLDGAQRPAVVAVTSDHGEALGAHGERTHGIFAYEETLAVPLVLWGAGVPAGRDDRPARHVDLLPTLLARVGVTPPPGLPGVDLLAGAEPLPPTYFEALTASLGRGWAPLRGVLRDHHKYVELPVPELYDLASDPAEATNLFRPQRRLASALAALLPPASEWPPERGAVTAEQEAKLRSLGYTTSTAERRAYTAADDPKQLIHLDGKLHESLDRFAAGDYAGAASLAREVLAERPGMPEAVDRLAFALRYLDRNDEAIRELQRAMTTGHPPEYLRRQLADTLLEEGRPAEALAVLEPVAASLDVATLVSLAVAHSDAGRQDEAAGVLRRARELHPSDPRPLATHGMVALRAGDVGAATAHLEAALRLNEALPLAWNTLGVARYRSGDPAGAIAAWQRAYALDPRRHEVLYNLGLVAAEAGRTAEARQALERFVSTAPAAHFAADLEKARELLRRLPR